MVAVGVDGKFAEEFAGEGVDDIIAENKRRLDFVTSSLDFDPSLAEGLTFIREEYAEMIPEGLAPEEEVRDGEQ